MRQACIGTAKCNDYLQMAIVVGPYWLQKTTKFEMKTSVYAYISLSSNG